MKTIKSLITETEKEIEKITYIEEIRKYLERFSKEDILEGYSIENISLDDKIMYELLKEDIKLNPYVIQEREIKTIFGIKVLKSFALGKSKNNLCIWLKKDGFGAGCYEIDMDKLKEPLRIKLETLKLCQEIQDEKEKKIIEQFSKKDFIMSILNDCVTVDVEEGMKFICIDDVREKFKQQLNPTQTKE